MGFSDLLKGGISSKSEDDYRDVTDADVSASNTGSGPQIKSAEVSSQNDVVPVKDAIYEGNIVIIDLAGLSPEAADGNESKTNWCNSPKKSVATSH